MLTIRATAREAPAGSTIENSITWVEFDGADGALYVEIGQTEWTGDAFEGQLIVHVVDYTGDLASGSSRQATYNVPVHATDELIELHSVPGSDGQYFRVTGGASNSAGPDSGSATQTEAGGSVSTSNNAPSGEYMTVRVVAPGDTKLEWRYDNYAAILAYTEHPIGDSVGTWHDYYFQNPFPQWEALIVRATYDGQVRERKIHWAPGDVIVMNYYEEYHPGKEEIVELRAITGGDNKFVVNVYSLYSDTGDAPQIYAQPHVEAGRVIWSSVAARFFPWAIPMYFGEMGSLLLAAGVRLTDFPGLVTPRGLPVPTGEYCETSLGRKQVYKWEYWIGNPINLWDQVDLTVTSPGYDAHHTTVSWSADGGSIDVRMCPAASSSGSSTGDTHSQGSADQGPTTDEPGTGNSGGNAPVNTNTDAGGTSGGGNQNTEQPPRYTTFVQVTSAKEPKLFYTDGAQHNMRLNVYARPGEGVYLWRLPTYTGPSASITIESQKGLHRVSQAVDAPTGNRTIEITYQYPDETEPKIEIPDITIPEIKIPGLDDIDLSGIGKILLIGVVGVGAVMAVMLLTQAAGAVKSVSKKNE